MRFVFSKIISTNLITNSYIYIIHINLRNMGSQIIPTQNPLSSYNIMIYKLHLNLYINSL